LKTKKTEKHKNTANTLHNYLLHNLQRQFTYYPNSLQCRWTSCLAQSANIPKTCIQPSQTDTEDIFIWSL